MSLDHAHRESVSAGPKMARLHLSPFTSWRRGEHDRVSLKVQQGKNGERIECRGPEEEGGGTCQETQ